MGKIWEDSENIARHAKALMDLQLASTDRAREIISCRPSQLHICCADGKIVATNDRRSLDRQNGHF